MTIFLLAASILLQFTAAGVSLRFINKTGSNVAWSIIAAALVLMGVRRSVSLVEYLYGGANLQPSLIAETVALVISALMLTGITKIGTSFHASQRSEEKLKESEALVYGIMNNTEDAIITIDELGHIDSFNRAAERLFDYGAKEVIGENISILTPEPHKSHHDGYLKDYLRSGKGKILGIGPRELLATTKNGKLIPIDLAVTEMWVGEKHRFIGVIRDITERTRLRKRLDQTQKMEAIGNLTGGVAHDFNNLLSIVLGNLELLQGTSIDGDQRKLTKAAIDATYRGADLTKNMLSFARRARLEPTVLDLNQVVMDTQNWSIRTLPATISIETSLLAGLWPIKADLNSTENALLNLIINARNAMPEGGKLTIETSNVRIDEDYAETRDPELEPGRYVMLAVSDTGCGIAPEIIENIFEPFFTTSAPNEGSGLGLSMVLGFMKQSGGTVRVYSEVGEGTTFKLFFNAEATEYDAQMKKKHEEQVVPSAGRRVLIAEDETGVREVLRVFLAKAGYQVITASSGDEALTKFIENAPIDLLLTDIVMPGRLQGPSLAKELREIKPNLPVVFMSGYASEATVHGNGLRPEDIRLMKPVSQVEMIKAIEKSLQHKQSAE